MAIGPNLSAVAAGMGGSAAVQDLGLGGDLMAKTQQEIDEMKRRKKLQGGNPAMSPALMSLTGNQY